MNYRYPSEPCRAVSPGEVEVLPPEGDSEFGLTLAEFEAAASEGPSLLPDQLEVLPPEEPGGVGVTMEQLESMRQSETVEPSSFDPIPPD